MAYAAVAGAHTKASGGNDNNYHSSPGITTTGVDLFVANHVGYIHSGNGFDFTDNQGNTYTKLTEISDAAQMDEALWYKQNPTVAASGHTFSFQGQFGNAEVQGFSGSMASPLDQQSGVTTSSSGFTVQPGSLTPSVNNCLVVTGVSDCIGDDPTVSAGFTITDNVTAVAGTNYQGALAYAIQTTATATNPTWTWTTNNGINEQTCVQAIFKPSAGIAFDAAGNSGDQAAASSYSGSASWSGSNRALAVDVSLLGAAVTVTAMTYGGAACRFIGARSTVTSFGRVEQWLILSSDSGAPASGSNTLSVTLSGSLEFSVEWASYTDVHQTSPTEGFNSNQATNTGSATDASVVVTTTSDNCWIHAAVVANDTSITANQTSRNNISGTLGSGANEDNNAAVTPAGNTTMSYTGLGITATWAIAGYALRPTEDAALVTLGSKLFLLLGLGT